MKIVWYSEIKWDYMKTRKQHLLTHFPVDDKILFFQPFSFNGPNAFIPKTDGNVTYVTLPVYRKTSSGKINALFQYAALRIPFYMILRFWGFILRLLIIKGTPDKYVFSNIFSLPLKRLNCVSLWDYNDDPEQFGSQPVWAMDHLGRFLRDPRQVVTTCSRYLTRELEAKYNRSVLHIPNGVDLSVFADLKPSTPLLKRNILGYVGVISPWFFDFELVGKIAETYPDFDVHLYGPVDRDANDQLQNLLEADNIKYFSSVDYSELPQVMGSFRIGLIPLRSIPQVWQAASAKFLQYLSTGIPVVSTYMEQFEDLSKEAFMCRSHDETLAGIAEALRIDRVQIDDKIMEYDWKLLSVKFREILQFKPTEVLDV